MVVLDLAHFFSLQVVNCSSKPLLNKVNKLDGLLVWALSFYVQYSWLNSHALLQACFGCSRMVSLDTMLISYPGFHISAGLSQLISFNGWYFNQFDWLIGLVPPLLYIFVWWLVFRINPNRSRNSVVCNFGSIQRRTVRNILQ